jgi:hypothetical protein
MGVLLMRTPIAPGMALDQVAAASPDLHRVALDAIPALMALAGDDELAQDGDG